MSLNLHQRISFHLSFPGLPQPSETMLAGNSRRFGAALVALFVTVKSNGVCMCVTGLCGERGEIYGSLCTLSWTDGSPLETASGLSSEVFLAKRPLSLLCIAYFLLFLAIFGSLMAGIVAILILAYVPRVACSFSSVFCMMG